MSLSRTINAGLSSGVMTLVNSATVSGAAATTLTVGGLDLTVDGSYYVEVGVDNATASVSTVSLFYNGDTTTTNYNGIVMSANVSAMSVVTTNAAGLSGMDANQPFTAFINITRDVDGKPRSNATINRGSTAQFGQVKFVVWDNTANVTSITLSASVALSLAVGSYIKVYKVGPPQSGTSNPTSPSTGQRYFRTDLGLAIYYDGTRWLTENEYTLGSVQQGVYPATATDTAIVRWPVPTDYQIYLTRFILFTYVATTNDETKYWTVPFTELSAANTVLSTIYTFSTISDTPTNWIQKDVTLNYAVDSLARSLRLTETKVSTPGNFYPGPSLLYRKIIT